MSISPITSLTVASRPGRLCRPVGDFNPRPSDTPFQGDTAFAMLSAGDLVAQFSLKISHTASRRLMASFV